MTKCCTGVQGLDKITTVQLYEGAKQSVRTCDNKKLSVQRPYWGRKRAVAFAVSTKEFGIFLKLSELSAAKHV
jgi:hypothetical protein